MAESAQCVDWVEQSATQRLSATCRYNLDHMACGRITLVIGAEHAELLPLARREAERALQQDPALRSEGGTALRLLLFRFERQDAVRLLAAG